MTGVAGARERLRFLADVVEREALYLRETDGRLFAGDFGLPQVASLPSTPDLAERVDAFVARFGRLQDTLGAALLPRLLEAQLEPVGTVLDAGVADLVTAALTMSARARSLPAGE